MAKRKKYRGAMFIRITGPFPVQFPENGQKEKVSRSDVHSDNWTLPGTVPRKWPKEKVSRSDVHSDNWTLPGTVPRKWPKEKVSRSDVHSDGLGKKIHLPLSKCLTNLPDSRDHVGDLPERRVLWKHPEAAVGVKEEGAGAEEIDRTLDPLPDHTHGFDGRVA